MFVVILIEPRREGEPPLTPSQQINDVVGVFDTEALADDWIARFQEHAPNIKLHYSIEPLAPPEAYES